MLARLGLGAEWLLAFGKTRGGLLIGLARLRKPLNEGIDVLPL